MSKASVSSSGTRTAGKRKLGSRSVRDERSHSSPEQLSESIFVEPKHILDALHDYFNLDAVVPSATEETVLSPSASSRIDTKTPLYTVMVVSDIASVDTHRSCFAAKVRLFLIWEVDLAEREEAQTWREEAKTAKSGYYALPQEEVGTFREIVEIPQVGFGNVMEIQDADDVGIRVYRRHCENSLDTIVWNMAYFVTIKQPFDLAHMPFDDQQLRIQVELTHSATWDRYHLTATAVIFHKDVKHVSQFHVGAPRVQKEVSDSIVHRRKTIVIPLSRHWQYFAHSLVSVFGMLSFFTQLAFCCHVDDVGDRMNMVITLFLTVVAFKFTLDLPKLNYATSLDHYILGMMGTLFCSGLLVVGAKKVENLQQLGICPQVFDFICNTELYWLDHWLSIINLIVNSLAHLTFLVKGFLHQRRSTPIDYVENKNFLSFHFARPYFIPKLACSENPDNGDVGPYSKREEARVLLVPPSRG